MRRGVALPGTNDLALLFRIADELEALTEEIGLAECLDNGTDFGLVAGVYTRDLSLAHWTAKQFVAGQVFVNEWFAGGVETPFGGTKRSGFGREKGQEAPLNYVQTKNVAIRLHTP